MAEPVRPPFELSVEASATPIVAAAIHAGHEVRPEVGGRLATTAAARRREEDPFTDRLTDVAPSRIVGRRSRFECDVNRSRDACVYLEPTDAWGIEVWREQPTPTIVARSRALHDDFYDDARRALDDLVETHGGFLLLDLHSYNHRRSGPDAEPADADEHPDVNIGTGTMARERWSPFVDHFLDVLSNTELDLGDTHRQLDVRENVNFTGGHFPAWVHQTYPDTGCAIAIEIKKIFMDEWTGDLYEPVFDQIHAALHRAVMSLDLSAVF